MRKYRVMESLLNNNIENIKKEVKELEIESKNIIENNENVLDLIKNCSFEQLMELNKNR